MSFIAQPLISTQVFPSLEQSELLRQISKTLKMKSRFEVVRLHAVPKALATKKELALIFQKNWNDLVSPGEVLYRQNSQAEEVMREAAKEGRVFNDTIYEKEVFM